MRKLIKLIFNRPILVTMISMAFFLFGLLSFISLKFTLFPSSIYPGLAISLDYPGGDANKMEEVITLPIEEMISVVGGIREIRSYTEAGKVKINIEFDTNVDLDFKTLELKERIDLISHTFPREAHKPTILKYDPEQIPILVISFNSPTLNLTNIRESVERNIKTELENIEGISQIGVAGGKIHEVLVSCDKQQLEAYGISLREVSNSLDKNNKNSMVGRVEKFGTEKSLYSFGKFKDLFEIQQVPVSLDYGRTPVLIQDIAEVKMAFRDEDNAARVNGVDTVSMYIYKTFSGDALEISNAVLKKIQLAQLSNISYNITYNQADYIRKTYINLIIVFFIGLFFHSIYLYFSFHTNIYTPIINLLSILGAFLVVCLFLTIFKLPLNLVTVSGIGIALVFWSFFIFVIRGYPRKGAFPEGFHSFGSLLILLSLSLIIIPILLLPFNKDMSFNLFQTNIVAIIFFGSTYFLFPVFFIILPREKLSITIQINKKFFLFFDYKLKDTKIYLLSKIGKLKHSAKIISFLTLVNSKVNEKLEEIPSLPRKLHEGTLWFYGIVIKHERIFFFFLIILFVGSIYSYYFSKKETGYSIEEKQIIAFLELPSGSNFKLTDKITRETEKKVLEVKGVKAVDSKVDSDRSLLFIKVFDHVNIDDSFTNYLKTSVGNTDPAYLYFSSDNVKTVSREVTFDILGTDLEELQKQVDLSAERAKATENISEVTLRFKPPREELKLYISGYKAMNSNLKLPEIGDFLKMAIQGGISTKYISNNREIDVRVRFDEKYRKSKDSLSDIRIKNSLGYFVPISEISTRKEGMVPVKIYHKNKKRSYSFSVKLNDVSNWKIESAINQILSTPLPENYRIELGKESGKISDESEEIYGYALLILPFFSYAILTCYFESFKKPIKSILVITVISSIMICFIYWGMYKISYPIFLGLFISASIQIFLISVFKHRGGMNFSYSWWIEEKQMKRKRPLYFFLPILSIIPFFLPFFLFINSPAMYVYESMLVLVIAIIIGVFLIPIVWLAPELDRIYLFLKKYLQTFSKERDL
ncbi:MAG: efflux RND transporter permease subunit [Leptospiraceae bacterium]|nr:efflux RND transporter permease subunit [Leptospiraceae bacterium]